MEIVGLSSNRFCLFHLKQRATKSTLVCRLQKPSVFQLYPRKGQTTLLDVKDAIEACEVCQDVNSRRECFEIFGLDSHKVDVYYLIAVDLEQSIEHCKTIDEKKKS